MQLQFGVTLTADFSQTGTCLTCNDGGFRPWTADVPAFVPVLDTYESLYLGFDEPFSNLEVALYVQVEPPTTEEVAFSPPSAGPSSSSSGSSSSPAPSGGQQQIEWQYW